MTYYRTEEWNKNIGWSYREVSITDKGASIEIAIKNAQANISVKHPALNNALYEPLFTIGIFSLCILFVSSDHSSFDISHLKFYMFLLIISSAAFYVYYNSLHSRRNPVKNKLYIYSDSMQFNDIVDCEKRVIQRALFNGAALQQYQKHYAIGKYSTTKTLYLVMIRFSAVNAVVGITESQSVAEYLVLMINEAMRQDLEGRGAMIDERTGGQTISIKSVTATKKDDL